MFGIPQIDLSGAPRLALLALLSVIGAAQAQVQTLPSMECGRVQANLHVRCTALGVDALTRDREALWTDVPAEETLGERYVEESECHARTIARCEQIGSLLSSYSRTWAFEQTLGSRGCEAGASGNGWIDPYLAWRAKLVLPRRGDRSWLLTIVANTVTAPTIRSYPDPAIALAPCHLTLTGISTSRDIAIPRGEALNERREVLSNFTPGEYLAELQCPAIQGSECRQGKASVSLQITASPDER